VAVVFGDGCRSQSAGVLEVEIESVSPSTTRSMSVMSGLMKRRLSAGCMCSRAAATPCTRRPDVRIDSFTVVLEGEARGGKSPACP
jgi:hypothetical protein